MCCYVCFIFKQFNLSLVDITTVYTKTSLIDQQVYAHIVGKKSSKV